MRSALWLDNAVLAELSVRARAKKRIQCREKKMRRRTCSLRAGERNGRFPVELDIAATEHETILCTTRASTEQRMVRHAELEETALQKHAAHHDDLIHPDRHHRLQELAQTCWLAAKIPLRPSAIGNAGKKSSRFKRNKTKDSNNAAAAAYHNVSLQISYGRPSHWLSSGTAHLMHGVARRRRNSLARSRGGLQWSTFSA
jgi:hypothetical protein